MSEDNVLDQIRQKRQRTTVPPREDTLVSREVPSQQSTSTSLEELQADLAKIPPTRRHSAIVLDQEIDQKLTRFCKESGITVEVFLEAAWLKASADSTFMTEIMTEASRRYTARKQAGKLRRLITMLTGGK